MTLAKQLQQQVSSVLMEDLELQMDQLDSFVCIYC